MASFNFPNSPTSGEQYTPAGGPTYTWDGIAWKAVVQGVLVAVTVSDTAPPNPIMGQLWWNSATGNMAIWYADADSAQWVQVSGSVSATPTAETRNRIVNGAMQISQELTKGSGTNSTSAGFVADQWYSYWVSTGTCSQGIRQEVSLTNADVDWFFRFSSSVADISIAATEYYTAATKIEGIRLTDFKWGTAQARPAMFRMLARSTIAGTFCVAIRDPTATVSFLKNCVITTPNVWTLFSFAIPGPTSGTWPIDTSAGLFINVTAAAGTNFNSGTDGAWSASGAIATTAQTNWLSIAGQTLEFTNVGLYLDPLATSVAPRWTMPDEAEELRACMRYWQRIRTTFAGNVTSGSSYIGGGWCSVLSRIASPALTGASIGQLNFPATVGGLAFSGSTLNFSTEARTANATGPASFDSNIIVNARM